MQPNWKRILWAVGPLVVAVLLFSYAGGSRVGVIDIGKIVKESPRARDLERRLGERFQALKAELAEQQPGLSEEERARKEEAATGEYLRLKDQLERQLEREIDEAVARVARRRRTDIVLFKESVRFGGVDITPDVIKELQ